jgi:hypothetical protein
VQLPPAPLSAAGQPSRDEAIRLLRGGLAKALMETAAQYVIPICWITARDKKPWIVDSGSAFLLDSGAGPFMVTANHVYEGFCSTKEKYPDAVCILGEIRFDLAGRRIASDSAYDVSTFRVTADEVQKLGSYANGKIILTGSQPSWPPDPPAMDHGVFFVGFPGDGRSMRPYRGKGLVELDWVGYTALAIANGVSNTDITLVFDHERDFDIGLRPAVPSDWALGGCSGAPLLTFVERNGVFSWRLGGIIYESSHLILKASRADCLNIDGSVNQYPNPMAYRPR